MVMGELPTETELVVIGGGPGGYAAAFRAADLGLDVTLICDEEQLGGTCLLRGCIPSKLLLELVGLRYRVEAVASYGLHYGEPQLDLTAMRQWKEEVVGKLSHGLDSLCRARGIQRVTGRAHFTAPNRLHIEGSDISTVSFRHAIIATGSRPYQPGDLEVSYGGRIMNSTTALELTEVPPQLLVVGGGFIGLELGLLYAGLGSRVTLINRSERLLPQVDTDLVAVLTRELEQRFESIRHETRVTAMEEDAQGVTVTLKGKEGPYEQRVDRVLVAVGRQANSDGLQLEQAGVEVDERGIIMVDEQCRSNVKHIFAVGDVAGGVQLAHKAMYEGKVAAEVIAGKASEMDVRAMPSVLYTEPQIAWCGETEASSPEGTRTVNYPWKVNGRALSMDAGNGVTKLLLDKESGRLLGGAIVGPQAESLISELTLAIEMGAVAEDLALTIHPHPTLSETVAEAAELYMGLATHLYHRN